jgi:steroid 5-alpha reductase family enzyme
MELLKNRKAALFFVFSVYLITFLAGILVFQHYHSRGILFATFAADIFATLVVWIIGVITKNSSLYDPYWSVAPVVIIPSWILLRGGPISTVDMLLLFAVLLWGIRLTYNWAAGWMGMEHQDWRYTMLKKQTGRMWFIVNLFGINLMPTVLVFLAMVPAYYAILEGGQATAVAFLGFIICIAAVLIQHFSDKQMKTFRRNKNNKGLCIDEGLWRYSRHPNYFAEVSLWFGIWLIQMGVLPSLWQTVVGPVLMALLFIFISIPMMEKHVLTSRPGYSQYKARVSMLIPWFRKNIVEVEMHNRNI